MNRSRSTGFTLIELMVVIAIIGILSAVVIASLSTARRKAINSNKVQELKQIKIALELYYNKYGEYPKSHGDPEADHALWRTDCDYTVPPDINLGDFVIPELITEGFYKGGPEKNLSCDLSDNGFGYSYGSNGTDYKLVVHTAGFHADGLSAFVDPSSDDGTDSCLLDGTNYQHFGIWTQGAQCWIENFECDYAPWCMNNG